MSLDILVIEDNEQNMYLVRYLLQAHGHQVREAWDGPSGVEEARRRCPDLILLDIQLPGMDGYAVAKALRALEHCAQVPIIAVTSYAMTGDREKALASGCTGYIEKPINPDTFIAQMLQAAAEE